MRYLKRFNESNSKDYMRDIEDILLEVVDIGLSAGLFNNGDYVDPSIQEVNGVKKEVIRTYIDHNPPIDDYSESFQFSDIKECVERLIDYMYGMKNNPTRSYKDVNELLSIGGDSPTRPTWTEQRHAMYLIFRL